MQKPHVKFGWSSWRKLYQAIPSGKALYQKPSRAASLLCGAASAILLASWSPQAQAGSVFLGFEQTDIIPGLTYANASLGTNGGVGDSGVLRMNTGNNQTGFLVLDDLDGVPIGSFVATFALKLGSASPVLHGDGVSFNFGSDIPDGTFTFPEEGTGSGLRVSFDTFNNAGNANEAPAIEVTFSNKIIASKLVSYLNTGTNFVNVKIEAHPDGTLDVVYGTNIVFTNLLCYVPTSGRFSFGAGAAAERFIGDPVDLEWIDNLSITTVESQGTFIQSAGPRGTSVAPDAKVAIQLAEVTTHVRTNSIVVKFDNSTVVSTIANGAGLTTITYDPPGLMAAGSTHTVQLTYADDAGTPKTNSVSYTFTVYPYVTLPATYAVSSASVNTAATGFKLRTHQVSVDAGTSVQRAELQFANKLLNPADQTVLPNIADLSGTSPDGTFDVPGFIDYSLFPSPVGYFLTDAVPPGLVTATQYALELTTFLNLAPGAYTFGINGVRNYNNTSPGSFRESGFRLTAGTNPKDLFAPELASFDKSRPEGEKQFSIVVQQAGIYPVRLLWFSGVGNSSLEWYQVMADGTRVLLGDVGTVTNYAASLVTHPYVQYTTTPMPNEANVPVNTAISLTIVDGSATVQTNTVHLSVNGSQVSASITNDPAAPGLTFVNYKPASSFAAGTSNTVRLTFTDSSTAAYDQQFGFTVAGNLFVPGQYVVEAEHYSSNSATLDLNGVDSHHWDLTTTNAGFAGDGAMVALPNINYNQNINTNVEPRLDYNINFAVTGTYYVWLRALADSAPGLSQNDSINVGIDYTLPSTSDRISTFPSGGYTWSKASLDGPPASFVISTTGLHVINVWMREDGFILDKILVTTNSTFTPTGFGPNEYVGESLVVKPIISFLKTGNSLQISWTGGGALESSTSIESGYGPVAGGASSPVTVTIDPLLPKQFFRVNKPL